MKRIAILITLAASLAGCGGGGMSSLAGGALPPAPKAAQTPPPAPPKAPGTPTPGTPSPSPTAKPTAAPSGSPAPTPSASPAPTPTPVPTPQVIDSIKLVQTAPFVEGVASSVQFKVEAFRSGAQVTQGPWVFANGSPVQFTLSPKIDMIGPADVYSVSMSGADCSGPLQGVNGPNCTVTVSYSGAIAHLPSQFAAQNGRAQTGNSPFDGLYVNPYGSSSGAGNFWPVIMPANFMPSASPVSFASGSSVAQTIPYGGSFGAAYQESSSSLGAPPSIPGVVENDTCGWNGPGAIATVSLAQANMTIEPGTNGTDGVPGSCVVNAYLWNDSIASYQTAGREREQIAVSTGGPFTGSAYTVAPSSVSFATAASGSQTMTVQQYATASGSVSLTPEWCIGTSATYTLSNASMTTNAIAASSVFTGNLSGSVSGTASAAFSLSPVGPGLCELQLNAPALTPPPFGVDSDANRYYVGVKW